MNDESRAAIDQGWTALHEEMKKQGLVFVEGTPIGDELEGGVPDTLDGVPVNITIGIVPRAPYSPRREVHTRVMVAPILAVRGVQSKTFNITSKGEINWAGVVRHARVCAKGHLDEKQRQAEREQEAHEARVQKHANILQVQSLLRRKGLAMPSVRGYLHMESEKGVPMLLEVSSEGTQISLGPGLDLDALDVILTILNARNAPPHA